MQATSAKQFLLEFPPTPRKVRRKSWTGGCTLTFIRVFILPHTLIGMGMLLSIPVHLYVSNFGTPVTATIDQASSRPNSKGRMVSEVAYHYVLDGHRYDEATSLDSKTLARMHQGDHLEGRASAFMGKALFVGPEWQHMGALGLLGMALFWNGILSVFLYGVWYVPLRDRWIVRSGEPAIATITGRKEVRGKGTRYILSYAFTLPDGEPFTGKCDVPHPAYQQIADGTPVTVLYNPRRPRSNLAYEFCDFEIRDDNPWARTNGRFSPRPG
jgi:hypothetical protein